MYPGDSFYTVLMGTGQTLKSTNRLKSSTPSVCYLNSYKDKNFNLFHNKTILLLNFSSYQCHLLLVWVWCINTSVKKKHHFKYKFNKDCF